jgi:hypothetical protein
LWKISGIAGISRDNKLISMGGSPGWRRACGDFQQAAMGNSIGLKRVEFYYKELRMTLQF